MVRPINPIINTQPPIAMLEYRIGLDKTRSSVLEGLGISERKCQISVEKKKFISTDYTILPQRADLYFIALLKIS